MHKSAIPARQCTNLTLGMTRTKVTRDNDTILILRSYRSICSQDTIIEILHPDYGIHTQLKQDMKNLEKGQRRAKNDLESQGFELRGKVKKRGLTTLQRRRSRDLIEIYKISLQAFNGKKLFQLRNPQGAAIAPQRQGFKGFKQVLKLFGVVCDCEHCLVFVMVFFGVYCNHKHSLEPLR